MSLLEKYLFSPASQFNGILNNLTPTNINAPTPTGCVIANNRLVCDGTDFAAKASAVQIIPAFPFSISLLSNTGPLFETFWYQGQTVASTDYYIFYHNASIPPTPRVAFTINSSGGGSNATVYAAHGAEWAGLDRALVLVCPTNDCATWQLWSKGEEDEEYENVTEGHSGSTIALPTVYESLAFGGVPNLGSGTANGTIAKPQFWSTALTEEEINTIGYQVATGKRRFFFGG